MAGKTPRALAALANLKQICETHLEGLYSIELIDLLENPQLASGDQILAVPTLVRKLPEPVKKIIGDLSNTERVLVGLDLKPASEARAMSQGATDRGASPARSRPRKPSGAKYLLRLYVTGMTPRSRRAIENIKSICEEYLEGRYDLEVIDICRRPYLAKDEQIIAAPTLIRKLPVPLRRLHRRLVRPAACADRPGLETPTRSDRMSQPRKPTRKAGPSERGRSRSGSLRARLEEAEETLRAIRSGEVDAVVMSGREGERYLRPPRSGPQLPQVHGADE